MIAGSKIVLNGKISENLPPEALTRLCLYQDIHILDGDPLFLNRTMEVLNAAFTSLFNKECPLARQQVIEQGRELLAANRFNRGSFWVRLFASPDGCMLAIEKQIVYRGPVLWHARPKAVIAGHTSPFEPYPTTAGLQCANFADGIAVYGGYDMALLKSPYGLSYASFPLIGVRSGRCSVAPLEGGGTDSPWRQAAFLLFAAAGIELREETLDPLSEYDEMLYICPLGIVSLRSAGDRLLFSSYANRLAAYISKVVE